MELACDTPPLIILKLQQASSKCTQTLFRTLAPGNIGIDLQPSQGIALRTSPKSPAAVYGDAAAVPSSVYEFAFPVPLPHQHFSDLFKWNGEFRLQQHAQPIFQGFLFRPAVQAFSTFVPVRDSAIEAADEDSVIGQIQQPGLFS